MNIVRFLTNTPTEVTLASSQGTVIEGRYGDQIMFTLADGRIMYVPPTVAAQIQENGIGAGERFDVCKTLVRSGRQRSIDWLVRKKDSPEQDTQIEAASPADTPRTQLEDDLRASIEIATTKKTDETDTAAAPLPTSEATQANKNGTTNGTAGAGQNGNGHPTPPTPVTKLEHALKTAIFAAHNAERYGAEIGYVVRFDSDAIKSMAITVLINMSEGARRWSN